MRRPYVPGAHQIEMGEHMLDHNRCAVWAPMGSGKTVEGLTVLHALSLVESGVSLVLAPKRVALNVWPYEAEKWEHLRGMTVVPIIGTERERAKALRIDAPVHAINYDNLPWLLEYMRDHKISWHWSRVLADESTRLKSFRLKGGGSIRARNIGAVTHRAGYVKRFIELTGTPSPNGLRDLWGQIWFLDEGERLGRTIDAFEQRWFRWLRRPNPTKANHEIKQVPLPYAMEQIQEVLSDICLTPTIPYSVDKPNVHKVYVDLPAKARMQYNEMEKRMFAEIGEHEVEAFTAATKTMKCLQMASGTVWVDSKQKIWTEVHDVKLQALESVVEEAAGMPVLVRYHWVPNKERILKAFRYARLFDGSKAMENEWNEGRIPLMAIHAASAGHGLSLQDGGNILADFDFWWDLEQDDQIIERIGPMRQKQAGHDRPVHRYRIMARDTCDELVVARCETKRSMQDILTEAMKRRQK